MKIWVLSSVYMMNLIVNSNIDFYFWSQREEAKIYIAMKGVKFLIS